MKILKRILITLGVIFVGFLCLAVFIGYSSSAFLDENREFVKEFSYDLSRNWAPIDVHARLSNQFLQALDSPSGKSAFYQLKALGNLQEISDIELGNYYTGTDGTTAEITFKAVFDNAKGLVTVTLFENKGKVVVHGFHVSAPDGISNAEAKHEA